MKMNKENWAEPRNPIRHYHTYLCIMRVKERKRKSRKNIWRSNDWKKSPNFLKYMYLQSQWTQYTLSGLRWRDTH